VGSAPNVKGVEAPGAATAPKASKTAPDKATETPSAMAAASPNAKAATLPLPEGSRVLHVGDSFAGALGLPLNKRLKAAGVHAILQFETASYIPGWSSGDKLQGYINRYSPDLVLITLGANELEIVNPEQRIRNIQKIVKTVGDRPCVWIATPLWDGAKNGLFEIIRQNIAPCLYMDTNALITSMPRVADGIHPTLPAREDWADVVVKWLSEHRRPTADKVWALAE
jgi:lysophospholipase L1-like esterase